MTFSPNGTTLVVANEASDTLVGINANAFDDADVSAVEYAKTGSPVSLVYLEAR